MPYDVRRQRWTGIFVGLALALIAVLAAASCNSSSAAGLSQSCSLNSDCNSPLVCVFSRCHEACHLSNDCPSGQRCVSGGAAEGGGSNVCQLPAESTCSATSSCSGTQVCAADQQCRAPCQTTTDCIGGQICLPKASMSLCYAPSNPVDNATLVDAGVIGGTGGDGGTTGDATIHPGGDASGDSTVNPADSATLLSCSDATLTPDGGCSYCPQGACAGHGTCISGNQDYTCQCFGGYSGTGTKTCTLLNSCLANNNCIPEYPCQPTAPPGQACLGQYAAWPVSDTMAPAGGPTVLPSYANNQDGTISDQVTTLMWQLNVPTGGCSTPDAGSDAAATCTVADAKAYCANLTLAGHTDWRLPTKIELESLLDYSHAQPPFIETGFLPSPSTSFWTASPLERALTYQWYVDFSTGFQSSYYVAATASAGSVRCIRGTGISVATPAVHYTIHAGAIDAGTGDAAITDDTVMDNWTGLTWQRTPVAGAGSIAAAQSYCAQLGSGFRLPTVKELLTLVNPILYNPAIDQTTFPGTPNDWFLSSTPNVPANGSIFIVHFSDGYTQNNVSGGYQMRCVR